MPDTAAFYDTEQLLDVYMPEVEGIIRAQVPGAANAKVRGLRLNGPDTCSEATQPQGVLPVPKVLGE